MSIHQTSRFGRKADWLHVRYLPLRHCWQHSPSGVYATKPEPHSAAAQRTILQSDSKYTIQLLVHIKYTDCTYAIQILVHIKYTDCTYAIQY